MIAPEVVAVPNQAKKPRKVLVLGSGPIVIGQAAEFDYSGTQACLACRESGVDTVLVNSNPATIQTDPHVADRVYIEPLTVDSIDKILAIERPEGIIASVGGQTALNLAVALDEEGVLEKHHVRVLGTDLRAIRRGEDRALFAETLRIAGQPILPSRAVTSIPEAIAAANEIGYPVMCRSAFALGGAGSGLAGDEEELIRQVHQGIRSSGSGQVLIEKSVYGWAEIEYEVVRDAEGNALVVCNMENVDPMGVHTGESIVVAPSQTLTDDEYHLLRKAALRVVAELGVAGACNVQFALNRENSRYYVIEVNPRLSRSSALASKATGYPIAKVAARIALGYPLTDIRNDITGTSAFFEPALDYLVVKIPRWPFDKFTGISAAIGTGMKSTGEVMAIGRDFEEALEKALRSIDQPAARPKATLEEMLRKPNAWRLTAIFAAIDAGWDLERVAALTRINPWFLHRMKGLRTRAGKAGKGTVYRMVDTCAGEFEARTPYFYGSESAGTNEASPLAGRKAIILGSGPIRIGQGIEFDYATVHACKALTAAGVASIIINNNPETVSTDYSTSDRLYFEPLDAHSVEEIVRNEGGELLGVIPQFGGQTAINLVHGLQQKGIRILGTQPEAIDHAEDRGKTSAILNRSGIPAPRWRSVEHWWQLADAVEAVGYPALLRPSYVLSGRGMVLARSREDVEAYIQANGHTPLTRPLLVDQFLQGARELDVDAVSDGQDVIAVVMEQIEDCGVHSGDSGEVYPVQTIPTHLTARVQDYTQQLARAFGVVGLMNVQYAVLDDTVYVLEVNPRASRSVPFASKSSGIPLADLAIKVILGNKLRDLEVPEPIRDRVSVKEVVFPFRVFPNLDPVLGPEMQSTGESMGIGATFGEAYWKALLGAGWKRLPFGKNVYISAAGFDCTKLVDLLAGFESSLCASPDTELFQSIDRKAPYDVDTSELGMAVVLGRSSSELSLLRRCVDLGVPYVSTTGGVRGLVTALEEGAPSLEPVCIVDADQIRTPALAAS